MDKREINRVIRKLKCSKKRRKEIKKELLSEMENPECFKETDFSAKASSLELVEEFNRSFSEKERKIYRREKGIRIVGSILLVLVILMGVVWWMLPKQIWLKDSETFEEGEVRMAAEQVIAAYDSEDYENIRKMSSNQMKEVLNTIDLQKNKELVGINWGKQISVGNTYMVEVTQQGQKYAVIEMHVQYENLGVVYTLTFDREMKLSGFWVK